MMLVSICPVTQPVDEHHERHNMRGTTVKRLRKTARIACNGDVEVYRKLYKDLVRLWKEALRDGTIAKRDKGIRR